MKSTLRFTTKISGNTVKLSKAVGTKIDGTINGLPFLNHPVKNNSLKLTQLMQKVAGDEATIEILRVDDETETRVPSYLIKSLKTSPKAKKTWDDITPIAKRDWVFWISSAKQEKTYIHRIETAISKLSSGMRRPCCFGGIKWLMKS